uniref:Uncharacterized protein n=1 Tax=Arundo donax TaxID=35708 RepID=A0A0A9FTI4_ARUDO
MDADLFDVVAGTTAANSASKQGRAREASYWNCDSDSDVFAVPEISPPLAKRARPPAFWCF